MWQRNAGLGSLIAVMIPYTLVSSAVWLVLPAVWLALGIPLGPS